ncbi:MAG TPA: tripartite tricarboxylate transporter substrate-binding protein [Reyranella sp.]|nr:tripartite tricarboxylate transporter substrate-binding protein [Reyranella sp.]HQS16040.1 tripartite tricarboxylate transporter substrate-binding protein [Reyranella sp.]HQT11714.1 tripartite tricarboxylate transporter substrate-binding protein [Reyranella sp.]
MTLARRDALRGTAAMAVAGSIGRRAHAAREAVRLICGFGVGNPTDLCAQLIQDGFSAALNEPVEFDYTLGQAGRRAALQVIDAEPDGRLLLIAEILNLVLQETPAEPLLSRLQPIAKVTRGFSTALAVNELSDIRDWPGLLAAAGAARLKAATMGADSTIGLLLALVERRLKLSFEPIEVAGTNAAVDLLLTRRADIAVVDTRTALLHNARNRTKLRVLATSGARRSPQLPDVPTLAELVGDRKLAYTISFGVFAPAATPAVVANRLTAALVGLRTDRSVQTQARLARIPLEFDGPSAIATAVARDRRVAADLAG